MIGKRVSLRRERSRAGFSTGLFWFALLGVSLTTTEVFAQGQDSTPGQRYLRVMAELLPGVYDNANQNYFDRRRQLADADRHDRRHVVIERVAAPGLGDTVFLWQETITRVGSETPEGRSRFVSLTPDGPDDVVVMRHWFPQPGDDLPDAAGASPEQLRSTPGCEYHFRRRADSFRGEQVDGACRFEWEGRDVVTRNTIELSARDLYMNDHKFDTDSGERLTGVGSGEPYWLERARTFQCYADIPGVGGGRDEPFERYEGIELHDKGGSHWFASKDDPPRNIGLVLQSVTWQVLNENNGNFNRNSLVVYVLERLADGSMKDHGYAFTEPEAERIGVNLKWMLVNCSLVPPSQARPAM